MSSYFFHVLSDSEKDARGPDKGSVNYVVFLMMLIIILALFFGMVVGVYAPAQIAENKIEAYQIARDDYCREWGKYYLGSGSRPQWKTLQVPPSYFLDDTGQLDDERIETICRNPAEVREGKYCDAKTPTTEYCMSYLGLI